MTGLPVTGAGDAVWDDGEWISWAYINGQIHERDEGELLERMICLGKEYFEFTGRHLPIWGEIGELYAERRFGIERHEPNTKGSDGFCEDMLVEIKTITPAKNNETVVAKRSGNFDVLIVVKVDEKYEMDARAVLREELQPYNDQIFKVNWSDLSPKIPRFYRRE